MTLKLQKETNFTLLLSIIINKINQIHGFSILLPSHATNLTL